MNLTPNFTLAEMTKSRTALRLGIDNTPSNDIIDALRHVAIEILQPVRDHFGVPVFVRSGYRSPALNDAINGARHSQHMLGQAADFEVASHDNYEVAAWIRDNLAFDQLILEFYTPGDPHSGWVHCSATTERNRHQCLTIGPAGTVSGLIR